MTRVFLALILTAAVALPASADVTIKAKMTGKGMGVSGTTTGTTYIKGSRMRAEAQTGDTTQITIFDLDARKMYSFDSKKKEADVWDMATLAAEMEKAIDPAGMKGTIKPTGQTRQINGRTAQGYDMEITVPAGMGGNKDMQMVFTLSGPVWIVKDSPGAADYATFYKAAAEKGFIFGDPRAAKAQPGQAKAMSEMYRQFAEIGGVPYEMEMQVKMGGASGPMAGLLARMGGMSMTQTVTSVEEGALSDDLFAPPAGYRLNQKK